MEVKASWRIATRPVRAAGPALAAFLITGAGVAGIAQPIDARPAPAAPAVRAATIRIVLPAPAAMTRATHKKAAATTGFSRHPLAPATPTADAALIAAQPAAGPATSALVPSVSVPESLPQPEPARLRMAPPERDVTATRTTVPMPHAHPQPPAGLSASRSVREAESPGALPAINAKPAPKVIPMVDAESRAALARMNGDAFAPSDTDRMDALQTARPVARSLAGLPVPREARPSGAAPIPMQAEETIGRYRRTAQGLAFEVATTINGTSVGPVALLIRDGDNISVRLADLLAAVRPAIDGALYDKLSSSQAAQSYMTFNELREAGIAVRFNDNDRLILGTR